MDHRMRARLDMIEPGRFVVLCEATNGGITGRTFASVTEALAHLDEITKSENRTPIQPMLLAA